MIWIKNILGNLFAMILFFALYVGYDFLKGGRRAFEATNLRGSAQMALWFGAMMIVVSVLQIRRGLKTRRQEQST